MEYELKLSVRIVVPKSKSDSMPQEEVNQVVKSLGSSIQSTLNEPLSILRSIIREKLPGSRIAISPLVYLRNGSEV